jgi:hypothetical protein
MRVHQASVRVGICWLCAAACWLGQGALALAQDEAGQAKPQPREKIKFESVVVGFPSGPSKSQPDESGTHLFRAGSWSPVYVSISSQVPIGNNATLSVAAADADDLDTTYTVPFPAMQPGEMRTVIAYQRPGSDIARLSLRLNAGREVLATFSSELFGLSSSQFVLLTLGSPLPNLRALTRELPPGTVDRQSKDQLVLPETSATHLSAVKDMPTQWFGYKTVDVVLLSTSNKDFLTDLQNDQSGRLDALLEWVRRGGLLVVSVGRNAASVAGTKTLSLALPVELGTEQTTREIGLSWASRGLEQLRPLVALGEKAEIPVVSFQPIPNRSFRTVMQGRIDQVNRPVCVQASYGLGRVTLVGFDLTDPALSGPDWSRDAPSFWQRLLREAGMMQRPGGTQPPAGGQFGGFRYDGREGMLSALQNRLEAFDGIPVVSFGWVALFILIYIIVVGPLDYLLLKKVFKRMELTWITFPSVVLIVSVAAYFTAYAIKGNDLRINKIDLVEIDSSTNRVYGTSWFTIFSPRIQNYTIGVDAAPAWAKAPADERPGSTVVSWLGRTQTNRKASIFSRSYAYADSASGLVGVPIQVWSTKSFVANWEGTAADGVIESTLRHPPGDPREITGTIKSNLPIKLVDAHILFAGKAYKLGNGELLPGAVGTPVTTGSVVPMENWSAGDQTTSPGPSGRFGSMNQFSGRQLTVLWPAVFSQLSPNEPDPGATFAGLREYDQSRRLQPDNTHEAILVAKTELRSGAASEIAADPSTASRLWLGSLPSSGNTQPPELVGMLRQETYVRVYLPIRPSQPTNLNTPKE